MLPLLHDEHAYEDSKHIASLTAQGTYGSYTHAGQAVGGGGGRVQGVHLNDPHND